MLPLIAKRVGAKTTHAICLTCGGLGLLATGFCTTEYSLFAPMIGVGIAWASILSIPYAMLAGSIPAQRMGVYMGVFNLFIVIPQIVMSFVVSRIYKTWLGADPLHVVMLGGAMLIVAALVTLRVNDKTATRPA